MAFAIVIFLSLFLSRFLRKRRSMSKGLLQRLRGLIMVGIQSLVKDSLFALLLRRLCMMRMLNGFAHIRICLYGWINGVMWFAGNLSIALRFYEVGSFYGKKDTLFLLPGKKRLLKHIRFLSFMKGYFVSYMQFPFLKVRNLKEKNLRELISRSLVRRFYLMVKQFRDVPRIILDKIFLKRLGLNLLMKNKSDNLHIRIRGVFRLAR